MPTPLQVQGDLLTERGYTARVATAERATEWRAEIQFGVYEGDRFIHKAKSVVREFPRGEGLLNHLLSMTDEARAIIAGLPALD